jgi:hypothetical protein
MVLQADSTYAKIEQKVRRLTASASEAALSSANIQQAVNTFYSQDFPYAIKLDQLREVYTIFTKPNIDVYPLDINQYQGIREPIYFEGIQGYFFKDRDTFFKMWPRFPTLNVAATGDGVTTVYTWTITQIPFLRSSVVIGSVDVGGTAIRIADDGAGNLQNIVTDPVGNITATNIGTVDYVTGLFSLTFVAAPATAAPINVWVSQYTAGRPYTMLFWNHEFTIRPVPDQTYKVEVEVYQTPTQFLYTTDNPKINQWWQYIAYGTAVEILRERNDMEGVQNLMEGFMRQEALVLERQGVEEIGQRNTTIYTKVVEGQNWGSGQGWY